MWAQRGLLRALHAGLGPSPQPREQYPSPPVPHAPQVPSRPPQGLGPAGRVWLALQAPLPLDLAFLRVRHALLELTPQRAGQQFPVLASYASLGPSGQVLGFRQAPIVLDAKLGPSPQRAGQ